MFAQNVHWPLWAVIVVIALVLVAIYVVVMLIGVPLLALFNRVFARAENSTAESSRQYLLGTVSLTIPVGGLGEVMVVGNGRARQTYPARSDDDTRPIAQGTRVVVVTMTRGVAVVEPVRSPMPAEPQ